MNIKLLLRVKEEILAEPRKFTMETFQARASGWIVGNNHRGTPPCGTVACIAGWASILSEGSYRGLDSVKSLLDLSDEQANNLFYEAMWPEEFRSDLEDYISGTPEYAKVAADRIDHFIATDGRE